MTERKFRNKEIDLIKKFYRIYKENKDANFLPFVICGFEISAGYLEIKEYFTINNKNFEEIISIFCEDFQYDVYYELKIIFHKIKSYLTPEQKERFSLSYSEFITDSSPGKKESDSKVLNDFCDLCLEIALEHKFIIVVENFHCASLAFLLFIKRYYRKIDEYSKQNTFQLHFMLFYKLEEFIDNNFKKTVSDISDKGLVFNLRNLQTVDFLKQITSEDLNYFGLIKHKPLWELTKGNVKLLKLLINYFSKIKTFEKRKEIFTRIKSKSDFFDILLKELSDTEKHILDIASLVSAPVSSSFLAFILENSENEILANCSKLVKKKLLLEEGDNLFLISSIEFRNYLIFSKKAQVRIAKFNSVLLSYEKFYAKETKHQLQVLKDLALRAKNDQKSKFYLYVLESFLPEKHNIFKRIEVLTLLSHLEENINKKADLIVKTAEYMIGSNKFLSAAELLRTYSKNTNIHNAQLLKINIMLAEIYYLLDDLTKIKTILTFSDSLLNNKLPEVIIKKFIKIKIRFFIETAKFNQALQTLKSAQNSFSCFKNEEELLQYDKAAILMEIGHFSEARKIYQYYLENFKNNSSSFKYLLILYKFGLQELYASSFSKAEHYFKKLLKLTENTSSKNRNVLIVYTKIRLAKIYLELNNKQKFLEYIYDAFNTYDQNNKAVSALIYEQLGKYYCSSESYEKAISCFKNARNNFVSNRNIYKKVYHSLNLAECYCCFKEEQKGFREYNQILNLLKRNHNEYLWNLTFLSMSRAAIFLNDNESCVSYLKQVQNSSGNQIFEVEKVLISYCQAKKTDDSQQEELLLKLKKFPDYMKAFIKNRKRKLLEKFEL